MKEHVAKALQDNGYPRRLVAKNWPLPLCTQLPKHDPPTATVTLLYVRHLSETIQRILVPLRICTSFWPHQILRQTVMRLKDHTPQQQRAGVVYRIPCGSCSTSVHWPNGQDYGTLLEGAQGSTNIRKHSPVRGSRACT